MPRYNDTATVGRSKLVPFRRDEDPKDRHARRLDANTAQVAAVQAMADAHGFTLRILNTGHHWELKRPGLIIDWWPSSAKCVINKDFQRGVHVHDHEQLRVLVEKTLRQSRNLLPSANHSAR